VKRGGPLRRLTPLAAVSPKRKAQQTAERRFKALVRDRDLWQCQGCGATPTQARELGLRLEVHHRLAKGRGGTDSPENGVVLCGFGNTAGCHRWVDHNRSEAVRRGLVVRSGGNPADVPLEDWDVVSWWLLPSGQKRRLSAEELGAA
jgi:hypothetical protein